MNGREQKYILAIDLGTSGPKVALVSTLGKVLGHEFEPNRVMLLPGGGAEQDPEEWWSAVMTAAKRLLQRGLAPVADIVAVGVTAQWSGTVPVDERGMHIANAVIWMDTRGAKYARELTGGLIKLEGYGISRAWTYLRLTGGVPQHNGKDSISHILFLKHERPAIYARAHMFLEPKDYLNARLTGVLAASFDSIILHWVTDNRDINAVHYHPGLLALAGVDRAKLPDLKRATDVLGTLKPEVAAALGLSKDVKVILGTPDVPSASVGSGAVRDFEPHLYVGTSSWITCHVPFKRTSVFHNMAALPSAIPGRYLLTNEQESAGACLTWLRDNLFFPADGLADAPAPPADTYQRFDKLVASVAPGSEGVLFLPYLLGERAPIDDHNIRAVFFNQSLRTTRAHLIRAVYEGVAFNSRWLFGYVEEFCKRRIDGLNIIGGGANSAVWCQIFADVIGRPIRKVKDPIQANARGVGLLAAVGLGLLKVDEIPDAVEIAQTFQPDPALRSLYDERFREFVALYHSSRKISRRLNRL